MRILTVLCALLFLSPAATLRAQELELREGAGRDLVASRCAICHSLDYIQMNSPFLDRAGWEKSLRKMIDAQAPLDEIVGAWQGELQQFRRTRLPYLRYR